MQADDLNVPKGHSAALVKQLFSRDQLLDTREDSKGAVMQIGDNVEHLIN